MSTIEGGMVCTNSEKIYDMVRMLRSHGMVRELSSKDLRQEYARKHPDLNPQFIFSYPAYNMRSTEINAVIGRNQLKRLDSNNRVRYENFKLFLENLDSSKFFTEFRLEGSVNYAFVLVSKKADTEFTSRLMWRRWTPRVWNIVGVPRAAAINFDNLIWTDYFVKGFRPG